MVRMKRHRHSDTAHRVVIRNLDWQWEGTAFAVDGFENEVGTRELRHTSAQAQEKTSATVLIQEDSASAAGASADIAQNRRAIRARTIQLGQRHCFALGASEKRTPMLLRRGFAVDAGFESAAVTISAVEEM